MIKLFAFLFLILLAGCGENSSPEGRMSIRIAGVQAQIDSLKKQNDMILDSLGRINAHLRKIQQKQ